MKLRESLEMGAGIVVLCFAVLVCLLVIKLSVATFSGIRNWAHTVTTTTPEEKAALKQEADAWAKDPTNPAVIAQKCIDRGGTPIVSSWDGRIKRCDGLNDKSVNIQVNQ